MTSLRFLTFKFWNYYVLKLLRLETITFSVALWRIRIREKKLLIFSGNPENAALLSFTQFTLFGHFLHYWIRTRNRERTDTKIRQYCSYLFLVPTALVQLY